ncbi:helix-turn-helix domain-containing protein [Paracoccus suum]|uniref:Helix-turn-helix domain-containing protein n=1 Tax=Paracoccus suum TaxID=2259340 RepID=A0A344PHH7_9RHOB|nr:helix-turn-helix domain-containing protein [Paracoccus suum]AXC48832.1 helix-turn-helix domain-containing protein [Paracoccus suum]
MTRVGFLLFDGFSNMVLSCLLEPLRAVRDQTGHDISWQVLTPDERPVRSSSGLQIAPDGPAATGYDMLILVAGYGYADHARHARHVRRLARAAAIVVGADTGAWIIAAAGLLSGQRATLHWSLLADFAEAFPEVQVAPDKHVTQGRIWSCGSASAALDLMLVFIGERFGQANAFLAANMFLHDASLTPDQPRARLPGSGSARLRQIVALMSSQIEAAPPLERIAAEAGVSLGKLDRMFRFEVGMAPGRYFQMLRLARARDMAASTDLNLREIALRCGYSGAPALSKAHRQAFGQPLRQAGKSRSISLAQPLNP